MVNTFAHMAQLRRNWRKQAGLTSFKAVLGDGLGNVSPANEPHMYYVRIADGTNSDGSTQYSAPITIKSGGGYTGSEELGTKVLVVISEDGEWALRSDRNEQIADGENPRAENPNSPYSQFVQMKYADIGYASHIGTGEAASMEVVVYPLPRLDANGDYQYFEGDTIDLTSDIPSAISGNDAHLLSLVYLTTANALGSVTSTAKVIGDTLSYTADVTEVMEGMPVDSIPIRLYRLYTGQTTITGSDEYDDGRQWVNPYHLKHNFAATAAPTVNDDISLRYQVGSWWFDVTNDTIYGCVDNTDGAAIWRLMKHSAVTRTTAATYNVVTGDTEIFANTDSNAVTVNLQAGVQNRNLRIVNTGTSGANVTISPNGSEHLIGLNVGFVLLDGESLIITYDTTDGWY